MFVADQVRGQSIASSASLTALAIVFYSLERNAIQKNFGSNSLCWTSNRAPLLEGLRYTFKQTPLAQN